MNANEPCPNCGEYHNNCYEFKELANEEIDEIWNPNCPPYALTMTEIRDFARAILRKAQEK